MKNQARRAALGIHLESDFHIGVRNKVAPLTLRVEPNQRRQRPEKPERVAAAFDSAPRPSAPRSTCGLRNHVAGGPPTETGPAIRRRPSSTRGRISEN